MNKLLHKIFKMNTIKDIRYHNPFLKRWCASSDEGYNIESGYLALLRYTVSYQLL